MVSLIQILQLTYYHLIQAHNLNFSFTVNFMLQASGLVRHMYALRTYFFTCGNFREKYNGVYLSICVFLIKIT